MKAAGRSLIDFKPLRAAEETLLKCCKRGELARLGFRLPGEVSEDSRVRAGFLRFLLLGGDEAAPVHEAGVRLQGAYIEECLDLGGATLEHPVSLTHCLFECSPDFTDAQISGALLLNHSKSPGFIAERLSTRSVMDLSHYHCSGQMEIAGARIGGSLHLNGARLEGQGAWALSAGGMHVNGDVFLCGKFSATGDVVLLGARIGGQLNCSGNFKGSTNGALVADAIVVGGGVFLVDEFKAEGIVRFVGAHITGQFICRKARFEEDVKSGLCATGLVMTGSVLLEQGFYAEGSVVFIGAQIDGDLICEEDAEFKGDETYSLLAARCVVTGKVRLGEGFHAHRSVNFTDARIATGFDGCGANFAGGNGPSLVLDRAQITGPLLLRNLVSSLSNASFVGAKVAELDDDESTWGENIALNGLVYGALSTRAPVNPAERAKWLSKQIPSLDTDLQARDPSKDFRPQPWRQLQRVLQEMGHAAEARELGILYEQQLRAIGHVGQPPARWPVWAGAVYSRTSRGLHALYGLLTGYGYRPMQLLVWFVGIWLACASVYWYAAARQGVFAPSNPLVFQNQEYLDCRPDRAQAWRAINPGQETPPAFYGQSNWYLCDSLREEYTGFSPLAFSLDVLMPLVDLQQEADWAPLVPTPKAGFLDEFSAFGWKHFVRLVIWFEILVGWGIGLLMVAIVSGLARRSE